MGQPQQRAVVPPEHEQQNQAPQQTALADKAAYRIAVGAVGFALVAFLVGAAWIAAGGNPVPTQYWSTGSGLAGALIGILSPSPTAYSRTDGQPKTQNVGLELRDAIEDLFKNRGLLILTVMFSTSLYFGITNHSPELVSLAAATGGALLGLLAPSPGTQAGS
jgi:Na+/melibiose symporter-like transporter